jgi:nitroreductase
MTLLHEHIKTSIDTSQHCQRNWDLSKSVSQEDLDLMIHAATQCPSKQNYAYYRVHVITDRLIIEAIHDSSSGYITADDKILTNSQCLANVLFAFEIIDPSDNRKSHNERRENKNNDLIIRDSHIAMNIATGYLNLTAHMLGYYTGYCQCFDSDIVNEILNSDNILVLLGVGHNNPNLDRKIHHVNKDDVYASFTKEVIDVRYYK